jgi:hypothetical protein
MLRNAGDRAVHVVGLRVEGRSRGLRDAGFRLVPDSGYARPLRLPQRVAGGRDLVVLAGVRVPRGGCRALRDQLRTSSGPTVGRTLVVRARVGGRTTTTELPLGDRLRVTRCEGSGGLESQR